MISLFMIVSIIYILVFFGLQSQLRIAEQLYLDNDVNRFETTIQDIKSKVTKSRYHLLLSYLNRMKGDWQASSDSLENAELLLTRDDDPILVFEIQANIFINAQKEKNSVLMDQAFVKMQQIMPTHPIINLLRGILYFEQQQYFKALQTFRSVHTIIFPNDWLSHAFRNMFPFGWKPIKESICLIHLKKYIEARDIIKKAPDHIIDTDVKNLVLGYSFVFEGMDKPLAARSAQFQIAYNFLLEIKNQNDIDETLKQNILNCVVESLIGYIDYSHVHQVDEFINFFNLWDSADARDRVSIHLLEKIEQHTILLDWNSFQKDIIFVSKLFTDEFKNTLKILFREKSSELLQDHKVQEVATFHKAVELLSSPQENYAQEILDLTLRSFDVLLSRNTIDMDKVRQYMTFFISTITDETGRGKLVMKLLERSERAWFYEKDSIAALQLIQNAQHLLMLSQKDYFGHLISSKLKDYYKDAVDKNDIRKITDLFKLMREYGLEEFISIENTDLDLYLNQAKKDLEVDRLEDAQLRASLVLQVEPYNLKALQVMSEVAFSSNEFDKALHYLQLLPQKTSYFSTLWEVSNFFTGDPGKGYKVLSERFAKEKPSKDLLYQLCEQSLERGWANFAKYWAVFLEKDDQQLKQYIDIYAFFLKREWNQVILNVEKLSKRAQQSLGVQAMSLYSKLQDKKLNTEQVGLFQALLNSARPIETANKREEKLLTWLDKKVDPYRVLGLYALSSSKNDELALKYFEQVQEKSDDLKLLMGKLYYKQQRYPEALDLLGNAKESSSFNSSIFLPWVLRSAYKQGKFPVLKDTYETVLNFYKTNPEQKIRDSNAFVIRTFCDLGRFDKVKEVYSPLVEKNELSFIEKLFYIQSEYRLNNEFEANTIKKKWFSNISKLKRSQQIVLMHSMLFSGEKLPLKELVASNAKQPKLTRNNLRNLLDMAVAVGDLKHATIYSKRLSGAKNSTEAISLARFEVFKSELDEAYKYVQEASSYDPHNVHIKMMRSYFTKSLDNKAFMKKVKDFPFDSVTSVHPMEFLDWSWSIFQLTKDEIDLVKIEEYFKYLFYIKEQLNSWSCEEFPICQNFMAFVEIALGNIQAGIRFYRDVISKDPSNFLALSGLGLSYINERQYRLAIRVFNRIAQFSQYKTFPWVVKGNLAYKVDDLFNAVSAFENALETRPNDVSLGLRYSTLLIETKNWEEAKVALTHVLNNDSDNAQALDKLLFCYFEPTYRLEIQDLKQLTIEKKELIKRLEKVDPERALYYQKLLEKDSLSL